MNRPQRGLIAALAYYTIVPLDVATAQGEPEAPTLMWLPLVGALVGLVAGAVAYAAYHWLKVSWSFVIAFTLTIGLTGALHLDGFLDCCDALLASVAPGRRLQILKDPHHGTFALAGMSIAAALWLGGLAAIAPARYPVVLAFSGAAARYAAIVATRRFPYAGSSMATRRRAQPPGPLALIANAVLVELLAWFVTPSALLLAPVATLGAWSIARWCGRRLGGGLTGDVYGALIVVTEISLLAVLGIHSPWASE